MNEKGSSLTGGPQPPDFFQYWESLGYFENIRSFLPRQFFILFEIARLIATPDSTLKARNAIEDLLKKDKTEAYDRDKNILINRMERNAPISDKMDIQHYKTIYDLKKSIPRELAWEKEIFDIKLLTRTLFVQKFFESDSDKFKPISQANEEDGRSKTKFEQKFYLLLDRSRSMEKRMRAFYSKSIVVEFFRRKMDSNAKLYYRAFDTKPGTLVKIEKKEDYPNLIEKVILTTTGGVSTNMQSAIFQAIDDISFDKDMTDAEILVVTDGLVHDLNIPKMKEKLKGIKLNILKIGQDMAEPNGYEIKRVLAEAGHDFNPFSISLKEIKNKFNNPDNARNISQAEHVVYKYMLECSDKIIRDIKEISHKFIEIEDIQSAYTEYMNKDASIFVEKAIDELMNINMDDKTLEELSIIYKKAFFLSQYIEFLLKTDKMKDNSKLIEASQELFSLKQTMLANPNLLDIIMRNKGFEDDKQVTKAAKKAAKENMNELLNQKKALSKNDIKNAKMIFTMGGHGGTGSPGQLLYVLFVKLWEWIKSVFRKIFRKEKTE
ncbi:MAG: hypothetical protein V1874_03785 [Spirochaetota bacterium]